MSAPAERWPEWPMAPRCRVAGCGAQAHRERPCARGEAAPDACPAYAAHAGTVGYYAAADGPEA